MSIQSIQFCVAIFDRISYKHHLKKNVCIGSDLKEYIKGVFNKRASTLKLNN